MTDSIVPNPPLAQAIGALVLSPQGLIIPASAVDNPAGGGPNLLTIEDSGGPVGKLWTFISAGNNETRVSAHAVNPSDTSGAAIAAYDDQGTDQAFVTANQTDRGFLGEVLVQAVARNGSLLLLNENAQSSWLQMDSEVRSESGIGQVDFTIGETSAITVLALPGATGFVTAVITLMSSGPDNIVPTVLFVPNDSGGGTVEMAVPSDTPNPFGMNVPFSYLMWGN